MKIFLDGTSSAGKSSVAEELHKTLKYKIVAVDDMTPERWFPEKNKFAKSMTHVDYQNDFMAGVANKAKNAIIDDITLEIIPLLKGPVIKILIYTNPMDLVRNVIHRQKKDFRYFQIVMQQYSEKYMAGTSTNYIDWISGRDIKNALEKRRSEFADQNQLNTYARQICDRLSIPYSAKRYYIRPVQCQYDIVINTRNMPPKKIADKIIQTISSIRGGAYVSSSKVGIPRVPTGPITIISCKPSADIKSSAKKSGHRVSDKTDLVKIPKVNRD